MSKKETKTSTTKKSSKENQVNEIPAPNQVSDAVVVTTEDAKAARNEKARQITDLALLANGLLKGKALSDFISRSYKLL